MPPGRPSILTYLQLSKLKIAVVLLPVMVAFIALLAGLMVTV